MMLMRPSLFPRVRRGYWIAVAVFVALVAAELVKPALVKPFVAEDIIATTTLTSQGSLSVATTSTLTGLVEAKAQIQVDGPAATTANVRTCNGNPSGSVIGTRGSVCMDPTTPALWLNVNGGTTWIQIGPVFTATAGGVVPASGGVAGTFLRADGVWAAPTGGGANPGLAFASDGAVNFDGVAAVVIQGTSIAPVANVYTLPAGINEVHGTNVTIATGVTVKPTNSGIAIYATGTLSGAGSIDVSGANAVANAQGATRGAGLWTANLNGGTGATAGNAGNGQSSGSCPNDFVVGVTSGGTGTTAAGNPGTNGPVGRGGSGGGGGGNGVSSGGNGGNNGQCTHISSGNMTSLADVVGLQTNTLFGQGGTGIAFTMGTGGGGGASGTDGASFGLGGGGGAGGGLAFVAAKVCSGTITINAKGGNGANGADGSTLGGVAGGGGGGAGGAGGIVGVLCGSGTAPTANVNGGTHGNGGLGNLAGGNGGNGGDGGAGFSGSLVLSP